ncbi:alcohol dehydrogenase catalytic domain-containing protein, partial [Corynebacterium durum]|uniref:alcohol dehydrogenase catalytic domain-containing protein n=1 Tax=Corynebacterium durum TaxID=61592 RepID=UPI0028805639
MRAAQFASYNGPQALHLGDITTPNITPRQVLVRVAGSSVNQMDVLEQEGKMKLFTGRSFPIGTGVDFAGTISAVGAHVSGYKVGDRVWGYVGFRRPGTSLAAADYIALPPHCLSPAPTTIPPVAAAAPPLPGLPALNGFAALQAGDQLLVIGGKGGA